MYFWISPYCSFAQSRREICFVVPFRNFEFKTIPFGLAQAPTHLQQLINEELKGLPFGFGYLDDILVFSENNEKHLEHLRTPLDRLQAADLKLNRTKCDFSNVSYIT